jgi:hypothetical protein
VARRSEPVAGSRPWMIEVLANLVPALKAAAISPIEALRSE